MTSSLVRRTVKKGGIFLVIEDTVYVANVSWNGVWQEVGQLVLGKYYTMRFMTHSFKMHRQNDNVMDGIKASGTLAVKGWGRGLRSS